MAPWLHTQRLAFLAMPATHFYLFSRSARRMGFVQDRLQVRIQGRLLWYSHPATVRAPLNGQLRRKLPAPFAPPFFSRRCSEASPRLYGDVFPLQTRLSRVGARLRPSSRQISSGISRPLKFKGRVRHRAPCSDTVDPLTPQFPPTRFFNIARDPESKSARRKAIQPGS